MAVIELVDRDILAKKIDVKKKTETSKELPAENKETKSKGTENKPKKK